MGMSITPGKNLTATLIKVLPLDLKRSGLDTAEHVSVSVDLRKSGQQKNEMVWILSKALDIVRLCCMHTHIIRNQTENQLIVTAPSPSLRRNLSVIGELPFWFFVKLRHLAYTFPIVRWPTPPCLPLFAQRVAKNSIIPSSPACCHHVHR